MSVLNRASADSAAAAAPEANVLEPADMLPQQVLATPAAVELIDLLRERHGPVMFHQSGGCCDGSSPMCFALGEFITGDSDVLLGYIAPTCHAGGVASARETCANSQVSRLSRSEECAENTPSGAPFYISRPQFEYWKHTQLILDVVPGRGGMFSLENPEGLRFLIRGRVFTELEIDALRKSGRI